MKAILTTLLIVSGVCLAVTTVDPAHPYAYGANIGWINAEADGTNGAVIGRDYCSGWMWGANIGWICLGDGSPLNHYSYANDYEGDFGVNHDGAGRLRGYAWGANIGWVAFEEQGEPRVDLLTGDLSGYAWGANIGWISLSNAQAFVSTELLDPGPDADQDGMPDSWEYRYSKTTRLLFANDADADQDGVSDVDEYAGDTDPLDGTDYLRITDFQTLETTNVVTWTCRPTRLYTLQYAAALSNSTVWADTGSSFVPPSGPEISEVVIDVTDTNRFYRVRAFLPLSP